MKLALISLVFLFAFSLITPSAHAATAFMHDLSLNGAQSSADVRVLQQFLIDQGVYTGEITGNFYVQTYKAVVAFQNKQGIVPASGFWGPSTRAKANALIGVTASSGTAATVATTAIGSGVYAQLEAQLAAVWTQLRNLQDIFARTRSTRTTETATTNTTTQTATTASTAKPAATTTATQSTASSARRATSTNTTTTTTTTTAPAAPVSTSGIAWGAYAGDSMNALTSLESTVGKSASIQAIFWGWDDTFPTSFNLASGKTLLIYWDPAVNYDAINTGKYDSYIASFAKGAATYAKSHGVILVPFSEMNLSEEVWGDTGANTPAKFVLAWKRVRDIFAANGATAVKFGLAYNNESTGSHKNFDDYYPGASYVDYVGVDGFNFGSPWQTPSQVFSTAMTKVASYGKPIYIFATASAAGSQKAAWITSFASYIKTVPNLRGFVWFNENKEQNWLVNSDSASLTAFKGIL